MARVTLNSRLPAIAAELRPRVGKAVKEGAEVVAEDAQRNVEIGPPPVHIFDHIKVRRDGPAAYRVDVDAKDPKGVPYAFAVEFGRKGAPPHPFLLPALEENQDNVVYLVTAALRGL